jgi:hypothetical protein
MAPWQARVVVVVTYQLRTELGGYSCILLLKPSNRNPFSGYGAVRANNNSWSEAFFGQVK